MSDKDKAHAAPDVETPATDLPDVETPREEASDAVLGEAAEASNFDFASAFNAEFGDEVGGETLGGDETITALITQIGDLSAERDDLKDKLMRSLAEAENTRRRAERDRKDAEAYGGAKLARDLLEVHDNFDRALASADDAAREHAAGLIEGVELTQKGLLAAFAKHKIEKVTPETGDKFDPNLHQAMFEAPVPGTVAGEIIQVSAEGFMLHDRLLRPAQVGVSSNPG